MSAKCGGQRELLGWRGFARCRVNHFSVELTEEAGVLCGRDAEWCLPESRQHEWTEVMPYLVGALTFS